MNNKYINLRIENIYEDLTISEKKIAKIVLKNPKDVILMTASELAKKSNTSAASVIRFCKSIGVPSFTELKLQLSAEQKLPKTQSTSDISPDENIDDIKEKLLLNANKSMEETLNLITDTTINEAIEIMENASLIYTYGIGSSYLVSENIFQKWSRIGKPILYFTDLHHLIACLASAPEDTIFIGISNSGETGEVITAMEFAKKNNIKTISLTQFSYNTLSKISDLSIQTVRSKEAEIRSAATSSLMSQFIAVDILFYAYILKDYDKYIGYIKKSKKDIQVYRKKMKP